MSKPVQDKKQEAKDKEDAETSLVQKRIDLNKVVFDTPAMLNMVKHCQENRDPTVAQWANASDCRGHLMGVIKHDIGVGHNNLFITQTQPVGSKTAAKTIKQLIEESAESKGGDNNEIGFYVSCELGLAFTAKNLVQMIVAYRNFRNAMMVVYDVNKSKYGMNPLHCFRFSQAAIDALHLNDLSQLTSTLVQDKITEHKLNIDSFFEEVDLKVHRSHLL